MIPSSDLDEIGQRLRALGLRPTRQRVSLYALLSEVGKAHVSAREVYLDLKRSGRAVSLATVYNNLKEFAQNGLLRPVAAHGHQTVFDTNTEPHHHIIDRRTGRIFDTDRIDYVLKDGFPLDAERNIVSVEITVTLGRRSMS